LKIQNIFSLDLGTTKFCIGHSYLEKNKKLKIDTVSIASAGMKKGMLINFDEARYQLTKLINIAEKEKKWKIDSVLVGISGSHLRGFYLNVKSEIGSDSINSSVIKNTLNIAKQRAYDPNREILHIISVGYKLDSREGITNPIGLSGDKLIGFYYIISASLKYLCDIKKLCNLCGLKINLFISEQYASSLVSTDIEKLRNGCCVLEIGGGTTDAIVYHQNKPTYLFTVNIAGDLITKDIASGLNTSLIQAEEAKKNLGIYHKNTDMSVITIRNLQNITMDINQEVLFPFISARIDELIDMIIKNLGNYLHTLGSGIIITGGGSELPGLEVYMKNKLNMPVNKIYPSLQNDIIKFMKDQNIETDIPKIQLRFATAIGLLNFKLNEIISDQKENKNLWNKNSYFKMFSSWFKDMLL
jgi:cell division protein FtsA